MTDIRVALRVRAPRLDGAAVRALAARLAAPAEALARRRGAPWPARIDVLFVGPRASAAAHVAATGAAGATDVITLAYAATPAEPARAELIVCPAVARAAAAARDPATLLPEERAQPWSADAELALYLAHGHDHLAGSDDAAPAGYRAMRRRELGWLAALAPLPRPFLPA